MTELTEDQSERHDLVFRRACELSRPYMLLADVEPAPLDEPAREALQESIDCFEEALTLWPENWSALWALGKVRQRLRQPKLALDCFVRALKLNPSDPHMSREAASAAMALGDAPLALRLCLAALELEPGDPGLIANLALAHLLNQDADAAVETATLALKLDPGDEMTRGLLRFARDVQAGVRKAPSTLYEVELP